MIYCREDCKRCRYIKDAWYFYCDAKAMNLSLEVGESGYCPACGIRLRPGGETEEMVSKRVALAAYDGQGGVMAEEMLPRHHLRPRRGL